MVKAPSKPVIVKSKKTGKRYIKYKNKRYLVKGTASDRYILKNFFEIIKQLIAQRRRRNTKSMTKKPTTTTKSPEITGNSIDAQTIAKIVSYTNTNKEKEIAKHIQESSLGLLAINDKLKSETKKLKHKINLLMEKPAKVEEDLANKQKETDETASLIERQNKMRDALIVSNEQFTSKQ